MPEPYHIEQVKEGQKANWPNEQNYESEKPTKNGYLLKGWDYDWENQPITQDTDIHPIWDKVNIHASTNVEGDIDFIGDSSNYTELNYWASTLSGDLITNGINFEEVELNENELKIIFDDYGEFIVNNKRVKRLKAQPNNEYEPRFYRFKAVTNNYGGMESGIVQLKQKPKEETPNNYVLQSTNQLNKMNIPIDSCTINLSAYISTLNGEYYDDLTFESNESWIQPNGIVTRGGQNTNIALIQADVLSLPSGQEYSGRSTTITVKQNGVGGLSSNLEIIQKIDETETQAITFIVKNDDINNVNLQTIHITLDNNRQYSFLVGTDIASGNSITINEHINTYFLNKTLNPTTPLYGSLANGTIINPDYLSINTTSLSANTTYTITYTTNV